MYHTKMNEAESKTSNRDATIIPFPDQSPGAFRLQPRHWVGIAITVVGLGVLGCNGFSSEADVTLAKLEDEYSDCVSGTDNPAVMAACSEVVTPPDGVYTTESAG